VSAAALPEEAVILAGGLGTRLRAVVSDVPKPMAPIAGRPFLEWLLEGLARRGVRRAVVATGHLAEVLEGRLGDSRAGVALAYSREEAPLGTGGALWKALALCRAPRVLALNGDTWLGADIAALAAAAAGGADGALAARPVPDRARYGALRLGADSRLLGMEEKGPSGPGLINAGLYLLPRDLPARRPMPGAFSFESEVLARPGALDLRAVPVAAADFLDIGTPEDFARAQELIPRWASAGVAA